MSKIDERQPQAEARKYDGCMPDAMFTTLNPEKEREFRQWARDNWMPVPPPKFYLYHPVIRDEWSVIDESMILTQPNTVVAGDPRNWNNEVK